MSVRLYLRDNTNGSIHEYGTNPHDSLILNKDGSLHYENLQNQCGTEYPEEGYTFVLADGTDPRDDEETLRYEEPYLDIGGDYYESGRAEEDRRLLEELFPDCIILD